MAAVPKRHRRRDGWMVIECVIALTVLTILLGGLWASQNQTARFNALQLLRQRCIAAGQAHLESIATTGEAIAPARCERLWPGVNATVARSPGEGDWVGLTLVKVTTRGRAKDKEVKVELARYVAANRER